MSEFSKSVERNYDESSRADRVIAFIEEYLIVPEGMHVGKPVVVREWQREIIRSIYDGNTRRAIISLARKNAKSALSAMLLIVHLAGPEHKRNSHIYSAARSRDQASIVFSYAAKMVRMSRQLNAVISVKDTAKELFCTLTGVRYKALSADATTAYGLSPSLVIHDELGQVRGSRDTLYDVLETAMGAQIDPLSIIISTQAPTDADLLSTLIDDAQQNENVETKIFLFAATEDDDINDPETWKKANPALGDFRSYKEMEESARRAARLPSFESSFRNLYLNQRISAEKYLIPPGIWALGKDEPSMELLETAEVYAGLDLSSRRDLTALVLAAKDDNGNVHLYPFFWAPEKGLRERSDRDKVTYDVWANQGILKLTPGQSVDYSFVAQEIADLADQYNLVKIMYDRWRINDLLRELEKISCSVSVDPFGQGYKDMSPAVEEFEVLALNGKLRHGNNPIMNMCVSNAVPIRDPAGNRKLDKSKPTGRIDGLIASLMAVAAMSKMEETTETSMYEIMAKRRAQQLSNYA